MRIVTCYDVTLVRFCVQSDVEDGRDNYPIRIPVVLAYMVIELLEFEQFYNHIREHYGYPDWVIVSTIFNIALNAKTDQGHIVTSNYSHFTRATTSC